MRVLSSIKNRHSYHVLRDFIFGLVYGLLSMQYWFKKRKGTLVYLGMNYGKGFDKLYWQYERAIGIEANPELFQYLKKKYGDRHKVTIIHGAATDFDGELTFNITENHGLSSSIGTPKGNSIKTVKQIKVPAFNLYNYFQAQNIETIDDYVSDIQGNDLTVLKTLQPMLQQKKIHRITSEVCKNEYKNSYDGLADNSLDGFTALLGGQYKLVSTGWEDLKPGKFREVPNAWWEMDCMWEVVK